MKTIAPSNSSSDPQWTPRQWAGISTVGRSLLVSAAAGSGKTAVLAERCAHLVCDAAEPCGIDQLLVVTFTESAAAEMKSRIQQAMQKRGVSNPSARLSRQLALVEHANVSTVHGFCSRVLRQNFNLLGIDPNFQILDDDEAGLLRSEVARDLFHRRYETGEAGDFQNLIDAYGNGNDERLIDQVVATHQLLCSLVDPEGWIARTREDSQQAAELPLEQSTFGRQLIGEIRTNLKQLHDRALAATATIRGMGPALGPYVEFATILRRCLDDWRIVLQREGLATLVTKAAAFWPNVPKMPSIRATTPGRDVARAMVEGIRKEMVAGTLYDQLSFSPEQWRQGMADVAPHAGAFLSLVSQFSQEYSAAKQSMRALDFSDLERLMLEVLKEPGGAMEPSAVARAFHAQFRHVLVDEYQDINEIQDAILTLVSQECLAGRGKRAGNLFCVGDVKQSIFRFRLAEPGRFLARQQRFSDPGNAEIGQVIDLRENFRSRAPLLEAINAVFGRLMTRQAAEIEYDDSHRLHAGRRFPRASPDCFTGAPIELHLLPRKLTGEGQADESDDEEIAVNPDLDRTDYEAILAARRIRQLMGLDGSPPMQVMKTDASGNLVPRPIEFGDIVILLRSMQFKADTFADVLRGHGIPVHSEGGSGFFSAIEIRDILCLLQILDNQQQDIPLAALLRSPLAGIPDADDALARIRLAYRDCDPPVPFHQAMRRYAAEQNDEISARLNDFLAELADFRDQANKRPVAELLWHIYDRTGYLAYCSGLEDGAQRVANLIHLHERAGQFGTFLRQGLFRFLRFLEKLRAEKELRRPPVASQAESVVRIMSIHRAKGLEFPVVVLADLGKAHNLQDAAGSILVDRIAGLGMSVVDARRRIRYPSLSSMLVRSTLVHQTLAEELRLLYVAMTRAKEHLILIGTCGEKKADGWINQWKGRTGALPADAVQSSRTVLDWLGPVAAMTENPSVSAAPTLSPSPCTQGEGRGEGSSFLAAQKSIVRPASANSPVFEVTRHSAADVRSWENPRDFRPAFSARQELLATLAPLPDSPAIDPKAKKIIERFEAVYPHEIFTHAAAAKSVTSLAKGSSRGASLLANDDETAGDIFPDTQKPFSRKLDLPTFFSAVTAPKATDIGTITHLALQHWDFAGPGDAADISRQIDSLLDRGILTEQQAGLVDRPSLQWMLASDVGRILRQTHDQLMREIPFNLAIDDPAIPQIPGDPLDRVMVRGRIDLLAPTEAGMVIVDYKTDNVDETTIADRAKTYEQQMKFYRQAIERISRRKVSAIYLVFLKPRLIRAL